MIVESGFYVFCFDYYGIVEFQGLLWDVIMEKWVLDIGKVIDEVKVVFGVF